MLESGESTYYPALNVGVDKPSTVVIKKFTYKFIFESQEKCEPEF